MLFERGLLRSVVEKTGHEQLTASVLVTLGLSLCIEDIARLLWGGEEKGLYYSLPPIILGQGSIVISSVRLLALGCIVGITLVVHQFLIRTYLGKALRAVTQNRRERCWSGSTRPTSACSPVAWGRCWQQWPGSSTCCSTASIPSSVCH